MQYTFLCKNRDLRESYSNNKKYLMQVMQNLNNDNASIAYEAIVLLSVFLLMQNRTE